MFIYPSSGVGPPFHVLDESRLREERGAAYRRFGRSTRGWKHGFIRKRALIPWTEPRQWVESMTIDAEHVHIDEMRDVILFIKPDDAFAFKMRWC